MMVSTTKRYPNRPSWIGFCADTVQRRNVVAAVEDARERARCGNSLRTSPRFTVRGADLLRQLEHAQRDHDDGEDGHVDLIRRKARRCERGGRIKRAVGERARRGCAGADDQLGAACVADGRWPSARPPWPAFGADADHGDDLGDARSKDAGEAPPAPSAMAPHGPAPPLPTVGRSLWRAPRTASRSFRPYKRPNR